MTNTFTLEIITPYQVHHFAQVLALHLKTQGGQRTILAGHCLLAATLPIDWLTIKTVQGTKQYALHQGVLNVGKEKVHIISEALEEAGTIDLARAQAAKRKAQKIIAGSQKASPQFLAAEIALQKALNRLKK